MRVIILDYKNGVFTSGVNLESEGIKIGIVQNEKFNIRLDKFTRSISSKDKPIYVNDTTAEKVVSNASETSIIVIKISEDEEKWIVTFDMEDGSLSIEESFENVLRYCGGSK